MSTAALIVGLAGLALAVASLTWQIVVWLHAGSRVKVESGWGVFPPASEVAPVTPVVTVTARNVGRTAVTVTGWGFDLPDGQQAVRFRQERWQTPVPHRLEPGDEVSWFFPAGELHEIAAGRMPPAKTARAFVRLATNKRPRAPEEVDLTVRRL